MRFSRSNEKCDNRQNDECEDEHCQRYNELAFSGPVRQVLGQGGNEFDRIE
jgi:hypothetical protein